MKPLTVFIGPNSSGKSYLAMLIYALLSSFRQTTRQVGFYGRPAKDDKQLRQSWEKWLRGLSPSEGRLQLPLGSLPEEVKDFLNKAIIAWINESAESLTSEVKRCYRAGISELVRREEPVGALSLSLRQEESGLDLHFSSDNDRLKLDSSRFLLPQEPLDIGELPPELLELLLQERHLSWAPDLSGLLMEFIVWRIQGAVLQDLLSGVHYLPAARSGILQGHKGLARSVIERSPLVGIEEPLDMPRFTGVIADFLGTLLTIDPIKPTEFSRLAELLQREAIRGKIVMRAEKHLYPEIFYQAKGIGRLPLHRVSSGISEVAPLILFLKYVVSPGHLLIIEEPEAHLHPAAQRKLARVLVRLIRANTKVLITTHSDYLVQQLSNFVSLSQIPAGARARKGYGKEDYVLPEEVGAYLFRLDESKGGSFIEELRVDKEGIPAEEFARVAGELYDEMAYLRRKLLA